MGDDEFNGGETSFGDVEHLKGFQPLRPDLSDETRDLVLAMRGLFEATGLSLREFAARHHFSPPSVSRYLKGDRIPDKQFLDVLMKSACELNGREVTADLQAHLYQRHREALMADQPARYREQMASDRLEDEVLKKDEAELRIRELEGDLSHHRLQVGELETRIQEIEVVCVRERQQLGTELDLYRRRKADLEARCERLNVTIEGLEARLAEAVRERDAARVRCAELEAELAVAEESAERERLERLVAEERLRAAEAAGTAEQRRVDLERARRDAQQDAERLRLEAEAQAREIIEEATNRVTRIRPSVVSRSAALRQLRDEAVKVADVRLPELVLRLSSFDPGDVEAATTAVKPIAIHTKDEIGEVARAFDRVHLRATRIVAQQAQLRAVFSSVARRQQALLTAQRRVVSDLAGHDADPYRRGRLFRLDHLITRLWRGCETLQILAGERPAARWDGTVSLAEVFGAASFEVEQYERLDLSGLPEAGIDGFHASGLVHLLAELLENATVFSPPHAKVGVVAHLLPDGRIMIEINDRGLGLNADGLADINGRLANLPMAPDAGTCQRMGLFVVGRICELYGFRVQLRPNEMRGATALVMLPPAAVSHTHLGAQGEGTWDSYTA
ncbi:MULTISPECIES: ATP-binding protein [unclassified Streptomyces]|uniref:ATP-binding protein n=1 Tax=unclassified Streptomyces TaxID=2593676 RepID=UPI00381F7C64